MKQNEIKQHLINGTLEQSIKANNRTWFLIVCLFIIIFGGYSAVLTKRNINLSGDIKSLNDTICTKNVIIGIQYETLKTAVYFEDIKK